MLHPVRAVTAPRTPHAAGRLVVQERRGVLGRQPTHVGELSFVVDTADDRDRELIEQQERYRLPPR
jgi:hypothetical protein